MPLAEKAHAAQLSSARSPMAVPHGAARGHLCGADYELFARRIFPHGADVGNWDASGTINTPGESAISSAVIIATLLRLATRPICFAA